jgi:hypothetical protein
MAHRPDRPHRVDLAPGGPIRSRPETSDLPDHRADRGRGPDRRSFRLRMGPNRLAGSVRCARGRDRAARCGARPGGRDDRPPHGSPGQPGGGEGSSDRTGKQGLGRRGGVPGDARPRSAGREPFRSTGRRRRRPGAAEARDRHRTVVHGRGGEAGRPRGRPATTGTGGFYIRNASLRWRTIEIDPAAKASVSTSAEYPTERRVVSLNRFAALFRSYEGFPESSPYWITIKDGRVIAIEEQYIP